MQCVVSPQEEIEVVPPVCIIYYNNIKSILIKTKFDMQLKWTNINNLCFVTWLYNHMTKHKLL